MSQTTFRAIGMMSGTSLDGLDLCHAKFWMVANKWHFSILNSTTKPYTADWKSVLETAQNLNKSDLKKCSEAYSAFLGESVLDFIADHKIDAVDFIASHGHTVFHQPENKITVQIGNDRALFDATNITTICDFRVQDVLLGGQGAPLVPMGDQLLFSDFDACLNLGGFANASLNKNGQRLAFDICPVNIVLNAVSEKLGFAFDDGGKIAQSGKLITELLAQLNALAYYQKPLPKSLGREWVEANILPLLTTFYQLPDVLHTFTEHAAQQISNALIHTKGNILVTGGGAFNTYFLARMKALGLKNLMVPNEEIIHQKEALVFAFLGVLRLRNEVNCLRSVTGARGDHSSGRIYCL